MEEADARLQEVVASLLNEHGGNHEQALRQTFACLHNSGLYEAQSAAEEEQREQQVLAVFRSFPFRAPAAPAGNGNGGGSLAEETQAPPPAYNTLAREPEEAGEVVAEQADPENVGENARTQPAPEASLPLNPGAPQLESQPATPAPPGPEVSHQGSPAPAPGSPQQQPPAVGEAVELEEGIAAPESFGSDTLEIATVGEVGAAVATGPAPASAVEGIDLAPTVSAGEGVEETKGGEWSGRIEGGETSGFPETGEVVSGLLAGENPDVGEPAQQVGSRSETRWQEEGVEHGADGVNGGSGSVDHPSLGNAAKSGVQGLATGQAGDPESTQQEGSATSIPVETPLVENGGSASSPHLAEDPVLASYSPLSGVPREEERKMDSRAGRDSASASDGAAPAAAAAAAATVAVAGAPTMTAVTEPHLKTAGQPLTHANRAQSPTGMAPDLQDKLKALKLRRKHRFVTMRIEGTEVVAETVAAPGEGPAELKLALPYSDCRYAVYDHGIVTADGRKTNKLFFFTWIPHNATPHNKMAYSHGKVTVRQRLEGLYDVAASSFGDVEVALGLVDEDEEDSDIEF